MGEVGIFNWREAGRAFGAEGGDFFEGKASGGLPKSRFGRVGSVLLVMDLVCVEGVEGGLVCYKIK